MDSCWNEAGCWRKEHKVNQFYTYGGTAGCKYNVNFDQKRAILSKEIAVVIVPNKLDISLLRSELFQTDTGVPKARDGDAPKGGSKGVTFLRLNEESVRMAIFCEKLFSPVVLGLGTPIYEDRSYSNQLHIVSDTKKLA